MSLTLKAFLSHRYKSPAVNTYFHDVFSEVAELQFDVDRGTGSTNVTRLERMIRDTDAFVGIYPFEIEGNGSAPTESVQRPTRRQLLDASSYFRLELDLAARASTPTMVFVDRRFGPVIHQAAAMFTCVFDHQEVTGHGGSPNRARFRDVFERFCRNVDASMQYERSRPEPAPKTVAVLLPPRVYVPELVDEIEARTQAANVEVERLPWPPTLDGRMVSRLQAADWIITDVGPASADAGVAAYLHGQAIPTLRLWHQSAAANLVEVAADGATPWPLADFMYGAYEVGYPKDIVRWTSVDDLLAAFDKRVARIVEEGRRVGASNEAREYFLEAALRKEPLFISYSGKDEELVAPIAAALRRRFQSVFDYRDGGESIEPGRPWLDQIFSKLDRSGAAVVMLSAGYLASGNCAHEARSIVAAVDAGTMTLVPVKLSKSDLALPPFLTDVQYLRAWEFADVEALADRIVAQVVALPKTVR